MKNTLLTIAVALGLTANTALANNFDNTVASVTAEFGQFDLTVEGDSDNGYTKLQFGATVLNYNISEAVSSELDVFAAHYNRVNSYGIGVEYSATYRADTLALWGITKIEYIGQSDDFSNGNVNVTPKLGAGYVVNDTVEVWSEVGYTWVASNEWNATGGVVEVGADFALAENVTFTPSVTRRFDVAAEETQLNLGVTFNF